MMMNWMLSLCLKQCKTVTEIRIETETDMRILNRTVRAINARPDHLANLPIGTKQLVTAN